MAFIVEIFRVPGIRTNGIDMKFHGSTWSKLLEIAESEGWEPMGTVMGPESGNDAHRFINNYDPDYPDSKRVSAEDAKNMAKALRKVKQRMDAGELSVEVKGPVIFVDSDSSSTGSNVLVIPGISPEFLEKFIQYIEFDAFEFWWDD
ncbi:MAG: hypothetical protein ACOYN6_12815 [Ignavibacteria bacterium]